MVESWAPLQALNTIHPLKSQFYKMGRDTVPISYMSIVPAVTGDSQYQDGHWRHGPSF